MSLSITTIPCIYQHPRPESLVTEPFFKMLLRFYRGTLFSMTNQATNIKVPSIKKYGLKNHRIIGMLKKNVRMPEE
jgi:hypothetical protein